MSEKRSAVVELYKAGRTLVQIAETVGCTTNTVAFHVKNAKARGELEAGRRTPAPVMRTRIVEMLAKGASREEVAAALGTTADNVSTQASTARRMGELPSQPMHLRRRDAENNVLGRMVLATSVCPVCELRGEHECLPGLKWYAENRLEVA